MRALVRHLDWQAVFAGFVGGYAVPVILACAMTPGAWALWFWIAAPIIAGYLAARLAVKLPLMHGLVVSVLGVLVFGLISSPKSAVAWLIWMAINAACSIFGASVWRRYARKTV